MNKIGTAHVLLSDSIHTLPIEEENMVAAASVSHGRQREQFIIHDGGPSVLGVGFREADLRPWNTMPGKRLRVRRRWWTSSSAAYDIVNEADALRWTSAPM